MSRTADSSLSIKARDTMYKVIHDGFLIGPERCIKKHWKGTCDACFLRRDEHKRETLKHILTECPFYTSIIRAVFFNALHLINANDDIQRIVNQNEENIVKHYARELITGCTKHTKITAVKKLSKIWPCIIGATLDKIMSARHQNANPDYPIQLDASNIFESIRNEIELYAKTARRKAEVKQNTLQIRYQHSQSDEESHLGKWKKDWGPLISEREGNLKLRFTKFENTPYLTLPQCMNNDEVQRRNSYRIHQANYNSRSTN
jgi:hypothetical protein